MQNGEKWFWWGDSRLRASGPRCKGLGIEVGWGYPSSYVRTYFATGEAINDTSVGAPLQCASAAPQALCVCTESVHPASVCVGGSEWLLGRSEHWQGRAELLAAKPRMRMAAKASIAAGNGMSTAVVGKRQHQQHQQRQLLRGGNRRC